MARIHLKNTDKTLEVEDGSNILRSSMRHGGKLPFKCGGGFCGTCMVKVEEGMENLDKVKNAEVKRLNDVLNDDYRLACQTFTSGDVTVSWDEDFTKKVQKSRGKGVRA